MRWYALASLGLLALTSIAGAQGENDKRIVPGQRIGPWTIELKIDDLNRINGPKQAIGTRPGETEFLPGQQDLVKPLWLHRWDHVGLRVFTVERGDQNVVGLTILNDAYKTAEGIGIGATRAQVIAAYGQPTAVTVPNADHDHLVYDKLGVTFRVWRTRPPAEQTVVMVNVFKAGTARERWK